MPLKDRAWQVPLRLVSGVYIVDSGLSKWNADDDTAKHLHDFASGAYPFLADIDPPAFARSLAFGEVLLGAMLLVPRVPARAAGIGLLAFGVGLLGLYARTPGICAAPEHRSRPSRGLPCPRTPGWPRSARRWSWVIVPGSGRRVECRGRTSAVGRAERACGSSAPITRRGAASGRGRDGHKISQSAACAWLSWRYRSASPTRTGPLRSTPAMRSSTS
jgi:uncharacterized membrane protein YphA (DoxX/SURF4 family)